MISAEAQSLLSALTLDDLVKALDVKMRADCQKVVSVDPLAGGIVREENFTVVDSYMQEIIYAKALFDQSVAATTPLCRRYLNGRSLIFRLPEEIFTTIMCFCIRDQNYLSCRSYDDSRHPPAAFKKQLAITQISSRWHEICVRSPTLWNEINLLWPPAAIEATAFRAKNVPLSLGLRCSRGEERQYFSNIGRGLQYAFWSKFIGQNMGRIGELAISLPVGTDMTGFGKFWDHTLSLPAPKIEKLELISSSSKEVNDLANLFAKSAPSLREIRLKGFCYQSFDPGVFESLTSLSLEADGPDSLPAFDRIPFLLSKASRLVHLSLRVPGDLLAGHFQPVHRHVAELQQCVKLEIGELFSDFVAYLFSAVSFPALRDLDVTHIKRSPRHLPPTFSGRLYSSLPPSIRELCGYVQSLSYSLQDEEFTIRTIRSTGVRLKLIEMQDYNEDEAEHDDEDEAEDDDEDDDDTSKILRSWIDRRWVSSSRFLAPFKDLAFNLTYLAFRASSDVSHLISRKTCAAILSMTPRLTRLFVDDYILAGTFVAVLNGTTLCPSLRL
ncbi:hypothetical protein SISNIDRAFT_488359 [Sistotremastrum niveocremeum HHB9708]|uniref:F-box domain-containing protein n=1 Tax=Sistotremastrum niveocremeum HHB9708 TaxID=1314777 RepID=A0A164REF2_9AGAM|nr:hypothetical protein SISNIDRAFT_488359 [Sistotremastrum niveocremeum HHB9708]